MKIKILIYFRLKKVSHGIAVGGKYGIKSLSPGRHDLGIEVESVSANPYSGYYRNFLGYMKINSF